MLVPFNAIETVDIDGEEYRLAVDIGIIDEIEDAFDCGFDQVMAKIGAKSVRIGKMTKLVKGLLSREHPALSIDEVAGLVFAHGDKFATAMDRLFRKAWPAIDATEAKGENPPKRRRGTGGRS